LACARPGALCTRALGAQAAKPKREARARAKLKARIYEVPIVYHGRTYAEGKKINWTDGVAAFYHLIRFQLKD